MLASIQRVYYKYIIGSIRAVEGEVPWETGPGMEIGMQAFTEESDWGHPLWR